jgi:electron transport complex protein RnfE
MSIWKTFLKGMFRDNPVLVMMIGICPILACSSKAFDALSIGLATMAVLALTNFVVSFFRKWIDPNIKMPIFIVVAATFVTIADYAMKAYFPVSSENLGIFVPLIVVNCIVLGRADSFAYRNGVVATAADSLGMGTGFLIVAVLLGSLREVLGSGSIFGFQLGLTEPSTIMILPPGAFLGLGVLAAAWSALKKGDRKNVSPCLECGMAQACHPAASDKCDVLLDVGNRRGK